MVWDGSEVVVYALEIWVVISTENAREVSVSMTHRIELSIIIICRQVDLY